MKWICWNVKKTLFWKDSRFWPGIYSRIPISRSLNFSKNPISRTKSHFPWICFTVILLPIFRTPAWTNFCYPLRLEKSGFLNLNLNSLSTRRHIRPSGFHCIIIARIWEPQKIYRETRDNILSTCTLQYIRNTTVHCHLILKKYRECSQFWGFGDDLHH